jgi:hypothetical protein
MDWRACKAKDDCAVIEGSCCLAWPANTKNKDNVKHALAAFDASRGDCAQRVCMAVMRKPVCEHGLCMVWQ